MNAECMNDQYLIFSSSSLPLKFSVPIITPMIKYHRTGNMIIISAYIEFSAFYGFL